MMTRYPPRQRRIATNRAFDDVIAALADQDHEVRAAAAYTLGQYGYQDACTALVKMLTDPSPMVREEAAYALGCLDDMRAAPGLLLACDDPNAAVRQTAVAALDKLAALQKRRVYALLTVASSAS